MTWLQHRSLGLGLAVLLLATVLSGCAPDANAELISPQLGEQLYAKEASEVVEAVPTAVPLTLTDLTPEEVTAGLPEDFAAALAAADPGNGANLALVNACVGCHATDPAVTMTGPTWYNIGNTAVNREPGVSPAAYLHTSIVDPNHFVVPGYQPGLMPQIYAETIALEDQADLVAYLLAQQGQ